MMNIVMLNVVMLSVMAPFLGLFVNITQTSVYLNKENSAASFYRELAAWVPDRLCNFYLMSNHKIAYQSTTTEAS
jgi:hypothetical protein